MTESRRSPKSGSRPVIRARERSRSVDLPAGVSSRISPALLDWFDRAKRALPWRENTDPYRVWLSEIMCQQTRVATVVPYFEKFVKRYPRVGDLASAPEETVLESWAGLGYYSRARNLHRAARRMAEDGTPTDRDGWRELPGIGDYTSAAISSIANGAVEAAIDGNVERVYCRLLGIDTDPKRQPARGRIEAAADAAISPDRPGDHNQALMELGATICTPKSPRCDDCPISEVCVARATERQAEIPVPRRRRKTELQRWVALAVVDSSGVWCVPDAAGGELLAGSWGPPIRRAEADADPLALAREVAGAALPDAGTLADLRRANGVDHQITFRKLEVEVVVARRSAGSTPDANRVRRIGASSAAMLPALYRKICQSALGALS